jgi:hypothetical protein
MTVSTIQNVSGASFGSTPVSQNKSSSTPPTSSFAATLSAVKSNDSLANSSAQSLASGAAQPKEVGGMYVGGTYYTPTQIKKFYADGGSERQFLEENGVTDLSQQRSLALEARKIAGPGTMQGDRALQTYFKEYQKYCPNGKWANDYTGYVNDMKTGNPAGWMAMCSGNYTGTAIPSADFLYGSIYGPGTGHDFTFAQSGHGPRGMGDAWK